MTWSAPRVAIAAALLIVAFGLRLAEVDNTSYRPINDAGTYLTLASNIAHTGDYWASHVRGGAGGTRGPTAYFPPAFPYLIAGVDLLDGHTTRRGKSIHPARISQAALGTVEVGLIGLVAWEAFGSTAGLLALAMAAGYPVFVVLSGTIVAENLLTAFVLLAVWTALRARRARQPYAWIAACGLFIGLATLTHQNGILILIPLAFAVWMGRPRWKLQAIQAPVFLIAITVITISPWMIRNAVLLHRVIPVSDENGITLAGTYNPASAANQQIPYKWRLYVSVPQDAALARESHHLTETELSNKLTSQAFHYIDAHPTAPLDVAYHNTLRMLELEGSLASRYSYAAIDLPRTTGRVGVISFWVLGVLAILGALTPLARRAPVWLWVIPLLLAISVVLVNVETPRFREPVDAFLILLAACALATPLRWLGRSPVRRDLDTTTATGDAEPVEVIQRLA